MGVGSKLEWSEIESIDGDKIERKGPKWRQKWRNNDKKMCKLDLKWGGKKGINFDTLLNERAPEFYSPSHRGKKSFC